VVAVGEEKTAVGRMVRQTADFESTDPGKEGKI
jgi:hypothetical protein